MGHAVGEPGALHSLAGVISASFPGAWRVSSSSLGGRGPKRGVVVGLVCFDVCLEQPAELPKTELAVYEKSSPRLAG